MPFLKKISPRRSQVRKNISAERFSRITRLLDTDSLISILLWCLFVVLCVPIITFEHIQQISYNLILTTVIVVLICLAVAFYIHHYQKKIIKNHARALALVGLFILLLAATKLGALFRQCRDSSHHFDNRL